MTLVGGVGDRASPFPRLITNEDVGGAGCARVRLRPRDLSVSTGTDDEVGDGWGAADGLGSFI